MFPTFITKDERNKKNYEESGKKNQGYQKINIEKVESQ